MKKQSFLKFSIVLTAMFFTPSLLQVFLFGKDLGWPGCFAQNVGINSTGATPNASALLDVDAAPGNNKGLLIPRLTTAQRNVIASPALGLFIYNTDCKQLQIWNGSQWTDANNNAAGSPPSAPTAGTNTPSQTQIIWNWNTSTGATTYYYNTVNNFGTATNNGASTSYTQTGLTCNTAYTLYIWAVNGCGDSDATTLNQTSSSCGPPPCSGTNNQFLTTIGLLNSGGNYGQSVIQRTDECRFLVSGQTDDYGAGGSDIMIANINPAGAVQWVKTIGGAQNEGASFLQNHSGGYYMGGASASWGWSGKSALFVTNFNAAHSVVWTKVIGNTTDDISLMQMTVAPDGSIYLLGEIFYTAGIIIKLDASGALLWSRRINNKSGCGVCSDYYQSAIATSDNGIAITGWSWSYRMTGAPSRQTIVVKFASNGNIDWAKIIGTGASGLDGLDSYGIAQASDGGYVISNGGPSHLLKLNSTGDLVWSKQCTDGGFFALQKIIAASDGGFFGAGVSTVWHPASKNTRTQVKYDSNGNVLWTRVDNDISDGHPNPWELDLSPLESDDGYLTAGYSHRHTDAYAETTMSLQKYTYTGNTCLSNAVTANYSDYLLIQIDDITSDVNSNTVSPAFSTASPVITPVVITPNNWTDCSQ